MVPGDIDKKAHRTKVCFICDPCRIASCPVNPLNAELNTICQLLVLLGAHHILHVSRIRVKEYDYAQQPARTLSWRASQQRDKASWTELTNCYKSVEVTNDKLSSWSVNSSCSCKSSVTYCSRHFTVQYC